MSVCVGGVGDGAEKNNMIQNDKTNQMRKEENL